MNGACEIDLLNFQASTTSAVVSSSRMPSAGSPSVLARDSNEIRGAGLLAGVESGEAVKSAAPLAVIRTTDFEAAKRAVIDAGRVITLPLFEYPGGRRFHFREPGGCELCVWTRDE